MSEKKEKTETKKADQPANNIVFVGKRQRLDKETGKYKSEPRTAPAFVQDGADKIKLPAPEVQAKGFYHEEAARIISLFPNDYKAFKPKG